MNPQRLADISPGELLASGIALVVVAAIAGGLAGAAFDYLRTRRALRAERKASAIAALSRPLRIPLGSGGIPAAVDYRQAKGVAS